MNKEQVDTLIEELKTILNDPTGYPTEEEVRKYCSERQWSAEVTTIMVEMLNEFRVDIVKMTNGLLDKYAPKLYKLVEAVNAV